jgi:hypothetical protein
MDVCGYLPEDDSNFSGFRSFNFLMQLRQPGRSGPRLVVDPPLSLADKDHKLIWPLTVTSKLLLKYYGNIV